MYYREFKHASVKVDGELIGSIGRGYMVLMGVSDTDTEEITDKMVDKMCKRVFLRMRTARQTVRWRMWMARSC